MHEPHFFYAPAYKHTNMVICNEINICKEHLHSQLHDKHRDKRCTSSLSFPRQNKRTKACDTVQHHLRRDGMLMTLLNVRTKTFMTFSFLVSYAQYCHCFAVWPFSAVQLVWSKQYTNLHTMSECIEYSHSCPSEGAHHTPT